MSTTPTPTENVAPRALSAILADRDLAQANVDKLMAEQPAKDASKADKDAHTEALEQATEALTTVGGELAKAKEAILQAQYEAKQAEYNAATTAGVKAALRRDMNRIREAQGLPQLIAGARTSGPRFSDDVLAILEGKI